MVGVVGLFLWENFSKFREAKKSRKREERAYIPFFHPRKKYIHVRLSRRREREEVPHVPSFDKQPKLLINKTKTSLRS
jgi:hypothetical protein